jgi:crotonobetainyl-CoA:carnitine CoA-transferase CaiB-like acyl-CoA transferase
LVENFSPGVMESFGLDEATIRQLRPDIILVRMPTFGLEGPWATRPGYAFTLDAISGMCDLSGFADGEPLLTGTALDATASLHAVAAVLAAILHKRSTGEGLSVELAMSDVTAQLTAPQLISASLTVAVPTRSGNRTPQMLASRLSPAIRFASRDACRKSVAWGHAARFLGLMTKRVTSRAMVERIAAAR